MDSCWWSASGTPSGWSGRRLGSCRSGAWPPQPRSCASISEKSVDDITYLEPWPVIEWVDANGASRQFTWRSNRSLGERIDIVYHPEDLWHVQIEGMRAPPVVRSLVVLIGAIALIAVIVGAMVLVWILE